MSAIRELLEAYGDNPVEIARNGLLGVARAQRLNKLPKDKKQQAVTMLVNSWITALSTNRDDVSAWIVSKLK